MYITYIYDICHLVSDKVLQGIKLYGSPCRTKYFGVMEGPFQTHLGAN